MIRLIFGLTGVILTSFLFATNVSAQAAKLEPLLINETLQPSEKKKGFVDVTNPTGQTLQFVTSVQAFRQKDNNGGLEFFDNEQVSAGLIPDLREFDLAPGEVLRMYFLVDGTKLPPGDVFAALFVSTKPDQAASGVSQAVRLGTIFTLVNGTLGPRQAEITGLRVPFFQFGDSITGAYSIKNTADPSKTTGFYPEVTLRLSPFANEQKVRSSLVMGGVERSMAFSFADSRFGLYRLGVQYGDSGQRSLVFVVTGIWKFIVPGILLILTLLIAIYFRFFRRQRRFKAVS